MPIPNPTPQETEEEFVGRCMHEIGSEYDQDQALAICYASFEKSNMSSSKFSEYRIKTQMGLAVKDAENRGIKLAEEGGGAYPWDECIADQEARYGDEETAKRVCGYIKSEYGG
jgi:hypothetical protein